MISVEAVLTVECVSVWFEDGAGGELTHLCVCLLCLVVSPAVLLLVVTCRRGRSAPLLHLSSMNISRAAETRGHGRRLGDVLQLALDVDYVTLGSSDLDIVAAKALFNSSVALIPLPRRCVVAEDNEANRYKHDEDTRDHERHPPRLVRGKAIADQGLVHRRHDKVSNTSTEVSESARERIRSANNILVEEARGPDLARHKAASKNTDEKPKRVQTGGIVHGSSEKSGYGAGEQAAGECQARAEVVACRAGDEAHNQCGCEGDDVGVCNLVGLHVDVAGDDVCEKGREG